MLWSGRGKEIILTSRTAADASISEGDYCGCHFEGRTELSESAYLRRANGIRNGETCDFAEIEIQAVTAMQWGSRR